MNSSPYRMDWASVESTAESPHYPPAGVLGGPRPIIRVIGRLAGKQTIRPATLGDFIGCVCHSQVLKPNEAVSSGERLVNVQR